MINVSELIADPDFTQPNGVTIERTTYTVVNHQTVKETSTIKKIGIITIANDLDLEMKDEADIIKEAIHVFTYDPLFVTSRNAISGTTNYSDVVLFRGNKYKVMSVLNDEQYGFCMATCYKLRQDVM